MKRSTAVTVISILSLLGSAFTFILGILMIVTMLLAPMPAPESSPFAGSPGIFRVILLAGSLMYFLPAAWGILTAIGLWRLKNWARISIIVFSILLILISGFAGLVSVVIPIPNPTKDVSPSVITAIRAGMGLFWFSLAAVGVWWLVFFNRAKVRRQFTQAVAYSDVITPPSTDAISASSGDVPAAVCKRPLSITIIAWFLVAGSLFIPLSLALHAPAILFTKVLTGRQAASLYVIFAVVQLSIGIGLLLLRRSARVAAIAYLGFGFLNSAAFYVAPGRYARLQSLLASQQSMFPGLQQVQSQAGFHFDPLPFFIMGGIFGLIFVTVPLYFLVTRKLAFEAAATLDSRRAFQ